MVRLVDDLLDVSRITRGKIDLRKSVIELSSVIQQAIETSRPAIESANQKLTVSLSDQPMPVHGDAVRLAQVFSNLLNNASKYNHPGGRIWVTAERQADDVSVTVKDNGLGIPLTMLPKVFDIFTQVDQSLERSQGGLGIGLTLVKRLVELHDGSVHAFSQGAGQGCEFVVRLPLTNQSAPLDEPARVPNLTTQRRILVVDDNRDSATTLAMLLRMNGNDTRTAHDGMEAVEVANDFRPEVVLLDIGLPRLNGYEVAQRIRNEKWAEKVVLVALTGWGQEEDRQKSRAAGFNAHLVKPLDHTALAVLLSELLPR
jgi:CheY-like chemotaxis protein/two-component sensor histidine kinase